MEPCCPGRLPERDLLTPLWPGGKDGKGRDLGLLRGIWPGERGRADALERSRGGKWLGLPDVGDVGIPLDISRLFRQPCYYLQESPRSQALCQRLSCILRLCTL
jgi:hypothetical protein